MSSLDSLLLEARQLAGRLQSREEAAEGLIDQVENMRRRLECQRQYQEEVCQLSELATCRRPRARLLVAIAAENKRVKELEAENAELRMSLEEHQAFMEMLMSKYREQMRRRMEVESVAKQLPAAAKQREKTASLVLQEKVQEMACVMREAVKREDSYVSELEEELAQLRSENSNLRQLLRIATTTSSASNRSSMSIAHQVNDNASTQSAEDSASPTSLKQSAGST